MRGILWPTLRHQQLKINSNSITFPFASYFRKYQLMRNRKIYFTAIPIIKFNNANVMHSAVLEKMTRNLSKQFENV